MKIKKIITKEFVMKRLLLIILTFMSLNVFAQIQVKEGSFKKIEGYMMLEKYTDMNDAPMAVLKISTENITAEQRKKFSFEGGNAITFVEGPYFKPGEMHLYISAQAATSLVIKHDDYGKTEFEFPYDLCDFCGYDMVVQYIPISSQTTEEDKPKNNYLTIVADQPDAFIFIDDQPVGQKETAKLFPIGSTHTWRVDCDLYHSESGSITITGEENRVDVKLRPAYGYLNITSSPESGAFVFVNNKQVGTTPYTSDRLASGTYNVRVMKEMYNMVEKNVVVTDGKTTKENLDMSATFVDVMIKTDANSDIYVDDELKGKGSWTGRLSDGAHLIEAKKAAHKTARKEINLALGAAQTITIDAPKPLYGFLEISSSPLSADIYIDGKNVGKTPKVISDILEGTHELRLEKQGCASLTKTITIKQGETLTLNESLQTGKEITITTDKAGDKIYVDGDYVGVSPVKANLSYGSHTLKAVRGSQTATKNISVTVYGTDTYHKLAFGRLITITSSTKGDNVYIDGKKAGVTPYSVDLSLGSHTIEVRRGKATETKTVILDRYSNTSYSFNPKKPKKESLWHYIYDEGIHFITVDGALTAPSTKSFGLTYGNTGEDDCGWYVSAMTNLNYKSVNKENDGFVTLNGNSSLARLSVMGGVIVNFGGDPSIFNLRFGGGYGMRILYYEDIKGNWYKGAYNTHYGIDLSTGVQLNLRHITISADFVTTNFKTAELKLGVGVNWKR